MSLFSSKQNSSLSNLISSKLVEYSKKITFTPQNIVCLNISKSAVEQISETYSDSNVDFINFSDLVNSKFLKDDASVDLLIANIAMLQDVQPDILLADARRILKITGVLIFATFDSSSLLLLKKYNKELQNRQIFDEKKMLEQLSTMHSLHFSSLKEHLLATDKPDIYIDCDIFFVSYPKKLKPNVKEEKELSAEFIESQAEEKKEEREKFERLENEKLEEEEQEQDKEKGEEEGKELESEYEPEEFEQKERAEIPEETEEAEVPEHETDEQENKEELEIPEKPEQETESGIESIEPEEKEEIKETEEQNEGETKEEIEDAEQEQEQEQEKEEPFELEPGEEESGEVENTEESQEVENKELDDEQEVESRSEDQEKDVESHVEPSENNVHEIPLAVDKNSETLTRLASGIHQNREELADHENTIAHHLNSTLSILTQLKSKDLKKEYRADKIAELKKNLAQHKQMLATYRSLYDKHKTLLNNFINTHEQATQKNNDPNDRYHQLIKEHQKLLSEHEDKINEHENFTNNLTI